jgi:hypothetical protein
MAMGGLVEPATARTTISRSIRSLFPHYRSTDPLFVTETNPSLAVNFEKPDLMRKLGVFVENVDGFDDLANKFTLRSAQNLQALANSTVGPDPEFWTRLQQ